MYINEAIKKSIKVGGYITRVQWRNNLIIKPTNTDDCCIAKSRMNPHRRGWQPFAEDLIADDWAVADDDFSIILYDENTEYSDLEKTLKYEICKYALKIMDNSDNMQEIAILPQLLKLVLSQDSES